MRCFHNRLAFLFAVISREARLSHAFDHLVKRLSTFFFVATFAERKKSVAAGYRPTDNAWQHNPEHLHLRTLPRISTRAPTCLKSHPRENKAPIFRWGLVLINSLTMSYFHTGIRTIIGAESFHCPVRDGKEWDQLAMVIRLNRWLAWFWPGRRYGSTSVTAVASSGSVSTNS